MNSKKLAVLSALILTLVLGVIMFSGSTTNAAMAVCTVPSVTHPTIQSAVNDLGCSTINVAPGTYTEVGQIVINRDLTIIGADKTTTIIKPAQDTGDPFSGDARGWFLIGNSGSTTGTFNMSGVTLDGATKNICHGVYDYFAGTIQDINVNNIGCATYYGRGIYLKNNATVRNVSFENIERIGVFIWKGATAAIIDANTYVGKGAGDHLDYGIELGNGGVATITDNTISNNTGVALSDGSTSAGILVTTYFGPGTQATITGNNILANTDGIVVGYCVANDNPSDSGCTGPDTSLVVAHFNNISGNSSTGIRSTGPLVDATCNWWGAADGPGPVGPGHGDRVSTNVSFTPWQIAPDGACIGGNVPTTASECKNGGWTTRVRADGSTFKNQGDCVSYTQNNK